MAMLAEPRRRKRYNLCPRGKALYEDDNRFGTKMLEKMGWTKGSGLGANQDGETDFVRIRFKNDAEGLGFEARDDQWTTHEEGFNGLLKSLNGEDNEANGKESDPEEEARPMGFGFKAEEPEEPPKKKLKEKISGMSLEEKSKQSRARVHYKKFTRGKDLSQYSEKDLANIFGKKATDDIEAPEPVKAEEPEEEKIVNPNFGGVQTVSTGLSVTDYFKQKMEAIKSRLGKGSESIPATLKEDAEEQANGHDEKLEEIVNENDQELSKKKKKKKDKERIAEPPTVEEDIVEAAPKQKKKKKSKHSSQDETEPSETLCAEEKPVEVEETNPPKRKKKKKDKHDEVAEHAVEIIEQTEEPVSKKKKNSIKKTETTEDSLEIVQQVDEPVLKKKNKSSKKEVTADKPVETENKIEEPATKKKKKSKKTELDNSEVIIIDDDLDIVTEPQTPLKNASIEKNQSLKSEDANQTEKKCTTEITEVAPAREKKKSKKLKNLDTDETERKETPPPASDATEKTSKKKRKSNNYAELEPQLEIPSLAVAVEAAVQNRKDSKRKEMDDVSASSQISGDKSDQSADEDPPADLLSLEEIKEKLNSFNTVKISTFCAEKFQLLDMSKFKQSTLGEVVGYGSSENVELEVEYSADDERRILDLWSNKSLLGSKKNMRYPTRVKRTTIRAVKKKNAFQAV